MYSHFPPINLPGLEGKENQTSVKSTNLVLRKQALFSGSQLSSELTSGHQELRSSQHEICHEQPRQTTELKFKLITDDRRWKGPGLSQLGRSSHGFFSVNISNVCFKSSTAVSTVTTATLQTSHFPFSWLTPHINPLEAYNHFPRLNQFLIAM